MNILKIIGKFLIIILGTFLLFWLTAYSIEKTGYYSDREIVNYSFDIALKGMWFLTDCALIVGTFGYFVFSLIFLFPPNKKAS